MKYTEEEMTALAAELLEVDLELPQVCPTWIDVNERLPDRSGRYMVVHQTIKPVKSKSTPVDIDTYDENEKTWTFFRSGIMQEVTHWMPIPEFKESDCD